MRSLAYISANVRGAADQGGNAPAGEKNAANHHEGNSDRRDFGIYKLDGRLGTTEPGSGGEAAKHSKGLKSSKTGAICRWIGQSSLRTGFK